MDYHYRFSRLAVDKAKLCPEPPLSVRNPLPRVAIVVARGDELLGWCAKGYGGEVFGKSGARGFQVGEAQHAEEALLSQLGDLPAGTIAYVTLEPCNRRRKGTSCAELLVAKGIREVHVGNCDPNPDTGALAWRRFHAAGVSVRDFAPELRNEARRDNRRFFDKFVVSPQRTGKGALDYMASKEGRWLGPEGRAFQTRWTHCGQDEIYAVDHKGHVCVAKNCREFADVDDPGRWFEDADYTKKVHVGEIVIFRSPEGFALVKVTKVVQQSEGTNAEVHFEYELRYRDGELAADGSPKRSMFSCET